MKRPLSGSIDDDLAPPDETGARKKAKKTGQAPAKPASEKTLANSFKGPQDFDSWYEAMHPGRWRGLENACRTEPGHFRLDGGLVKPYYLDTASVVAALCLAVEPGMKVLDLCAAPGGKSLVIAQKLFGLVPGPNQTAGSELVLNERSADRRGRLRRVIQEHLPPPVQTAIRFTAHDAARWGNYETAVYDRILLDVPCSSERHLIQNPKYLRDWSPGRSSRLADQAFAMVLSAAKALVNGGSLLYSTCAFSDLENDMVIERVFDRASRAGARLGITIEREPLDFTKLPDSLEQCGNEEKTRTPVSDWVEGTRLGYRIWPDRADGRGPLYFCRIRRTG
jgi:16S rRNA C967 or C1407 C5-methylase (RsmB/RsmF family)